MQATLQRPFASRETCEIAAALVTRRLAVAEALHPERTTRLAHVSCRPNTEAQP